MNIVLYVNTCLPIIGGREIVVHHLARAFYELGHRVRVVGPAGLWSQRKVRFSYPLHRWPTILGGEWAGGEAVWKLLIDTVMWGADIVHAHNTSPCGYAAAKLKSIRNLPLVITPHGEDIHTIPEIGYGQRLDPQKRQRINFALRRAELVTAISESIESSLLDAGTPSLKIRKIPNGIDIERFARPIEADVCNRLQIEKNSRLIVTVGNYRPCKGHEVLIRSMPRILACEPRARLVIIGKSAAPLQSLIEELHLQNKVILPGLIQFPLDISGGKGAASEPADRDWLAAIYQKAEIYVSTGVSEGAEGLSLALLEAMAAGLPVVASAISGNKDMVKNGRSGFLIPPSDPVQLADAVSRLLNTDQLRIPMGKESRKIAENYRWTRIAQQYLSAYEEARERNSTHSSK